MLPLAPGPELAIRFMISLGILERLRSEGIKHKKTARRRLVGIGSYYSSMMVVISMKPVI